MLALLTFPGNFGQFSASPFCTKAAYFLVRSGQPWKRRDMDDPRKMPHQKLPVLETPEGLVADSEAIREWLEARGADFDPGLSDLQKARSRAFIRMADEHLYFFLVMDRWGNEDSWPGIRDALFQAIPGLIRKPVANKIRNKLLRGLMTQGTARFSSQERMRRMDLDLRAIATIVQQSPFLFGDEPTAADYSIAPMLDSLRANPVQTATAGRVGEDRVLTRYLDRMHKEVALP